MRRSMKVSADQRGHGIGVSLDVYTKSNLQQKGVATKKLEDSIYRRKCKSLRKLERETGVEPATSSLGN